MGYSLSEQQEAIPELARQFADYLDHQTGIAVSLSGEADRDQLHEELGKLDLALGQLADLAGIYGSGDRGDIEPLSIPAAALAGELLRATTGATWMEPAYEGDMNLMLMIPGGPVIDMEGLTRTALLSHHPALAPLVLKLIEG